MTGAIGFSTHGRKIFTQLPFAKELELIAAKTGQARISSLAAFFRKFTEEEDGSKIAAIQTLIENHVELLADLTTWGHKGIVAIAKQSLADRVASVLQRNTVDGEALLAIGNFLVLVDDIENGLTALRMAADMTPTGPQRDTINARVFSILPHRHDAGQLGIFLAQSDARTILVADKGIDAAFVAHVLPLMPNVHLHFFGDLENKHLSDMVLPVAAGRSGCRDAISRYDADYATLAAACHTTAQAVSAVLFDDQHVRAAFPGNGMAATATLMISDQLFWPSYHVECLEKTIRQVKPERIVFLLNTNADLWQVATRYCNGPMAANVWHCAPSKAPAAYRLTIPKMRQMRTSWPMDQNRAASVTMRDAATIRAEAGHYVRYFLQCLKNRAVTAVGKMALPAADGARRLHIAGGYQANYLDSLKTLSAEFAKTDFDVTICDYGPSPRAMTDFLGVERHEDSPNTGTAGDVSYANLFTPSQNDIFPARLGKWLLLSNRIAIDDLCKKLRDDAETTQSVSDVLQTHVERFFAAEFPQIFFQYHIFAAYLERSKPTVVMLCPSRPKEAMLFAAACHVLQIKTVSFDAHILESSYARNLAIYADSAFVIAQYYADHYARFFRINENALHVVGSLRMGSMLDALQGQTRASAQHALGWAQGDAATVLLIGQPIAWQTLAPCVERFAQAIAMMQEKPRICLRLHREESAERLALYQAIFARHGLTEYLVEGAGEIGQLILASECVVGFFSTALIEAAAAGRSVIVIQPDAKQWIVDWSLQGLAQSARSWREIYEKLCNILEDPDAQSQSPRDGKDAVMAQIATALDSVINDTATRADFTAPSDIFVRYHMPVDIVG